MTSPPNRLGADAWRVIGVVMLGPFMTMMDTTIVNVSLSSIKDSLHSSISLSQWIITGYLLALALMLPLNAWLVDFLGSKRLYLLCFFSFTTASGLCGLAGTMPQLVMARVAQGVAGGILAPLAQLMMTRVAGRQMARVAGYAIVPILLAPLAGPPLAGVILQHLGWRWIFWVNLPVGVLAMTLAAFMLPSDGSSKQKHPLDLPGFLLVSPGLASLLYGLEQVAHGESGAWALLPGTCLCALFLLHASRKKEMALIDISLFKISAFSYATATQFLANGIMYGGQFLIPLYLTVGCQLSTSQAGWILGAMGLGMLCVYPFMGWITDTFGCRAVVVSGVALNFAGTLPFLWMAVHEFSAPLAIFGLVIRGLGQGATGIPSIAAAYAAVPRSQLGLATMTVNIVQRLGGPIVTTVVAISVSFSVGRSIASQQAFLLPFGALMLAQLLVIGTAIRLPMRIHPETVT